MDSKKNKTFCVKYSNHCKKVTNPNEANIRELFKIDRSKLIFAQYYDKDFLSYIDIEWNEVMELVDANELKIIEEVYCGEPQSRPTSESVELSRSDTIILDQSNTVILEELIGCSQKASSSEIKRQNAFQGELDLYTIEVSEDREEPSTSTTPKKQKLNTPIRSSPRKKSTPAYEYHPTTYVLPEISENSKLGMALQKKKPLTKGLKSLFLTTIYDSFSLKKKFYVEQGYEEIVHAILNAYPYLGGPLPYESAKHLWLKSLNNKFCNERKRIDCKEEITRCKAERILQKSFNVSGEGSSMFGIPCYYPKDGIKDQISVDSHKKWMSQEINLADRNLSGITSRMEITFCDRRHLLFANDNGAPTNNLAGDILREYPCLGIEDQAIGEIRRMFRDDNEKFQIYNTRVVSFSQKLYEAVQNSKSKYKTYMNELFYSGNSCSNENFIMYKCLGNMSILLLENPEHVISKSLNESHAPLLNVTQEEQVNLAVDGSVFIQ